MNSILDIKFVKICSNKNEIVCVSHIRAELKLRISQLSMRYDAICLFPLRLLLLLMPYCFGVIVVCYNIDGIIKSISSVFFERIKRISHTICILYTIATPFCIRSSTNSNEITPSIFFLRLQKKIVNVFNGFSNTVNIFVSTQNKNIPLFTIYYKRSFPHNFIYSI